MDVDAQFDLLFERCLNGRQQDRRKKKRRKKKAKENKAASSDLAQNGREVARRNEPSGKALFRDDKTKNKSKASSANSKRDELLERLAKRKRENDKKTAPKKRKSLAVEGFDVGKIDRAMNVQKVEEAVLTTRSDKAPDIAIVDSSKQDLGAVREITEHGAKDDEAAIEWESILAEASLIRKERETPQEQTDQNVQQDTSPAETECDIIFPSEGDSEFIAQGGEGIALIAIEQPNESEEEPEAKRERTGGVPMVGNRNGALSSASRYRSLLKSDTFSTNQDVDPGMEDDLFELRENLFYGNKEVFTREAIQRMYLCERGRGELVPTPPTRTS